MVDFTLPLSLFTKTLINNSVFQLEHFVLEEFVCCILSGPTEYVIAATKLINGATWLQSLMTELTPKPPNPF